MSIVFIRAAELAPVVHAMASQLCGPNRALDNLERAAALLAPALTANARAWNARLRPEHPDYEHPVDAADLLGACTPTYVMRTPIRVACERALRALGSLNYNNEGMTAEETAALLDAYALCARAMVCALAPVG